MKFQAAFLYFHYFCFLLHLPLQFSIFLLIPQLPAIHQVLPNHIGTRCYGSKRIEESKGEPDTHNGILLSQSLTGTDARIIMSAHSLTDGKLDNTDKERNDEQQGKNPSRNLGMEDITNRLAHQDSKVEAPHIEAQILHVLHLIHPLRQKLATQQSQKQRYHQDGSYIPEHHRTHIKKGHICPLLHHREKTRNNHHRKNIGYHRIGSQRTDASAQLLRYHRHSSSRRTDKTDKGSLQHQLGFIIIAEFEDKHHHHQCQTGSDELQDEMPSLRFHLLDFNLTEGNIEQGKEHHRHHIHQLRSHRIAQRFQERNIGEDQIAHGSQYQGTRQGKFSKE